MKLSVCIDTIFNGMDFIEGMKDGLLFWSRKH